jgi:hypothetical protein
MPISSVARPVIARPLNNTLPARNALAPRQPLAVDSFQPTAPLAGPNPQQGLAPQANPTPAAPASSSHGGFFSGLWGRIKNVFAGLLGQAEQKVDQAAPRLLDAAKGIVGNLMNTLFSKALGWVNGLFGSAQNKLTQ